MSVSNGAWRAMYVPAGAVSTTWCVRRGRGQGRRREPRPKPPTGRACPQRLLYFCKQPKEKPAQRQTVRSEEFVDASAREVSSQLENPAGVITAEQRKRLATIVERVARPAAEVSAWLKARYGVASSKDIKQTDYKAICQQLEARGALVFPGDGE